MAGRLLTVALPSLTAILDGESPIGGRGHGLAEMRLRRLSLRKYRKAKELDLDFNGLVVMIGPNGSGKSNILDSLRFLSTAAMRADFADPVRERGGVHHLAWKGEPADDVALTLAFSQDDGAEVEWKVRLEVRPSAFVVSERIERRSAKEPPRTILRNDYSSGERWWWSETSKQAEKLALEETGCAFGAAGKNEGFAAREAYDHMRRWSFCDPNPGYLRNPSLPDDPGELDVFGRNLAARLNVIRANDPETFKQIRRTLTDITGVPVTDLDVKELEDGRLAVVLNETGLMFRVNQPSLSSGTLRILALTVALAGKRPAGVIAIEEPENYVHPLALEGLVATLVRASAKSQVLVTTHSPLVLNHLADRPEVIRVVSSVPGRGTVVTEGPSRESILKALHASGFSLGEFWLSKGFAGQG